MPTVRLSEHFTLDEFTASQTAAREGINNQPDEAAFAELQTTAALMEKIRSRLGGVPVLILSGYRCPALNAATGGASNSAHMFGRAADFHAPGFGTPRGICKRLEPHMAELEIDQLIFEFDSWVHVGRSAGPPRHMALTINSSGTATGIA